MRKQLNRIGLALAVACALATAALGQSDDYLILLPDRPGDSESPQKVIGTALLPLVAECLTAKPLQAQARRNSFAIFEYSEGVGFPAASSAETFIDAAGKAEIGQAAPYTLVMVTAERKRAPSGRYTNRALVYSSTFDYCLFDMPARALIAKDTFAARPPASIDTYSNTYSELRHELASFIGGLPVGEPPIAEIPSPNP